MKLVGLNQRLATLESKAETPKVRFVWYDEAQVPPEPGTTQIKLKWLDEVRP